MDPSWVPYEHDYNHDPSEMGNLRWRTTIIITSLHESGSLLTAVPHMQTYDMHVTSMVVVLFPAVLSPVAH